MTVGIDESGAHGGNNYRARSPSSKNEQIGLFERESKHTFVTKMERWDQG